MNQSSAFKRPGKYSRTGVVLVVVLACIAVMALLLVALVKGSMQWGRQSRYATWKHQADQLVVSGLNRAVGNLQNDDAYSGETWELSEADGLQWPASITIAVNQTESNREIEVNVVYAEDAGRPVRSSRTVTLNTAEKTDE